MRQHRLCYLVYRVVPDSGIYEMIPGFILATLAIVVVSLITPEPKAEIVDTFDNAEKAYHTEMQK